ncbi:hypothetical protein ACROYT_G014876 [Oculina patagonica]
MLFTTVSAEMRTKPSHSVENKLSWLGSLYSFVPYQMDEGMFMFHSPVFETAIPHRFELVEVMLQVNKTLLSALQESIIQEHQAEIEKLKRLKEEEEEKVVTLPGGCSWSGPRSTLENHLPQCDMKVVECPFKGRGCILRAYRRDLAQHLPICPSRTINCSSCGLDIPHVNQAAHDDESRIDFPFL